MRVERVSDICGTRGELSSIDFQPHSQHRDSHRLATAGGPTIKIWSISRLQSHSNNIKWRCLYTNTTHSPYDVILIRFSFDGRLLLSVNSKGSVIILKMRDPRSNTNANSQFTQTQPNSASSQIEFISPELESFTECWSAMDELIWPSEIGKVADACWAPDNRSVAAGGSSGVAVIDIYTRQIVAMFGISNTDGYMLENIKSLSWDPMTIFIAVTTSTTFSLWRRSKNNNPETSYKWTFTLDKSIPITTLSQSISFRPSWCPRGRLVSVPIQENFPNTSQVKSGSLTMGSSMFLIEKPECGSTINESPLLLLGHVNKVTNVRFSSDIVKCDDNHGGSKVSLFAQSSEDGVISVWSLGFDGNNSKCLVVLSSVLDEQVAVTDLAWGNHGNWLAIAQTCGGIILLDFDKKDTNMSFYTNWMKGRKIEDTIPPQPKVFSASQLSNSPKADSKPANAVPHEHYANSSATHQSLPIYYEVVTCYMALVNTTADSDEEMTWLDMDSVQPPSSNTTKNTTNNNNSPNKQPKTSHPETTSKKKGGNAFPATAPIHSSISPKSVAIAGFGVVTILALHEDIWKPSLTYNIGKEIVALSANNGYIAVITKTNNILTVTVITDSSAEVVMTFTLFSEQINRDTIVRSRLTAKDAVIAIFNKGRSFTVSHVHNDVLTRIIEMAGSQREFLSRVTGFAILDSSSNISYQTDSLDKNTHIADKTLLVCIFKTNDGHIHLCPAIGKYTNAIHPLDVGKVDSQYNAAEAAKESFNICMDRSARPDLMTVASSLLGNSAEFTFWFSSLLSKLVKEQNYDRLFLVIESFFKAKILPYEGAQPLVIDDKIENPLYKPFIKQLPIDLDMISEKLIYPILKGEISALAAVKAPENLLFNIPLWIREIKLSTLEHNN